MLINNCVDFIIMRFKRTIFKKQDSELTLVVVIELWSGLIHCPQDLAKSGNYF